MSRMENQEGKKDFFNQCLGSGSAGSATFWLPGSGPPDPRGKMSIKTVNCSQSPNLKVDY